MTNKTAGPDSLGRLPIRASNISRVLKAAGIVTIPGSASGQLRRARGVRVIGSKEYLAERDVSINLDLLPTRARRAAIDVSHALTEAGYTVRIDVDLHTFDGVEEELWGLAVTRLTPDKTKPVPADPEVYELRADLAREKGYRKAAERRLTQLTETTDHA